MESNVGEKQIGTNYVDLINLLGSMSMSFTMKIRGVPFEAGEKEVFEVRQQLDYREEIRSVRFD